MYKKSSEKIGGFLQYSVYIFLGHHGCFWKINLRILWNHIINVTESYSPKQFLSGALSNYETFALLTAEFSTFDRFTHKFIVELHAM